MSKRERLDTRVWEGELGVDGIRIPVRVDPAMPPDAWALVNRPPDLLRIEDLRLAFAEREGQFIGFILDSLVERGKSYLIARRALGIFRDGEVPVTQLAPIVRQRLDEWDWTRRGAPVIVVHPDDAGALGLTVPPT